MKLTNAIAAVSAVATSIATIAVPASAQFYSGTQTAIGGTRFQNGSRVGGSYTGTSLRMGVADFYTYNTPSASYGGATNRIGGTKSYNFYGY